MLEFWIFPIVSVCFVVGGLLRSGRWPIARWAACLLLILSRLSVGAIASGADSQKPHMPVAVEGVLECLPEDTETIVVAQSFKIEAPKKPGAASEAGWQDIQNLSLGDLPSLDEDAAWKQLVGSAVAVAVNAGRDFEVVSSFGPLRYEGCSVIRFQEPFEDAGRVLTDALRSGAKEVRTVAAHELFVFPDRTPMEATYRPKPWQGQFIALPAPDTLLCATSDRFLREVLERLAHRGAGKRALSAELPEWKYVDTAAPVWALRHVPGRRRQSLAGLTWCLRPRGHNQRRDTFEVRYLPVEGQNVTWLANVWKSTRLGTHPTISEEADGTVAVVVDCQKEKPDSWYAFPIYWSIGDVGERGSGDIGERSSTDPQAVETRRM